MNKTLRLIRFHRPVGTLLLWFPTAWSLWLAYQSTPPFLHILYFFLGSFFMRSAGCIINDIADRHIDIHVDRTKMRPLTNGELSLPYALFIFIVLLALSFLVLIQLPRECFFYALAALFITMIYPFCKRFLHGPQFILSLAFSMGIPMAYTAAQIQPNQITLLLFILNFFWILAYDTLYAMSDKLDDLKIGVRSTAIWFGRYWQLMTLAALTLTEVLWICIGQILHFPFVFYLFWTFGLIFLIIQNIYLYFSTHPNYLQAFTAHSYYGLIMWIGLILTYAN